MLINRVVFGVGFAGILNDGDNGPGPIAAVSFHLILLLSEEHLKSLTTDSSGNCNRLSTRTNLRSDVLSS